MLSRGKKMVSLALGLEILNENSTEITIPSCSANSNCDKNTKIQANDQNIHINLDNNLKEIIEFENSIQITTSINRENENNWLDNIPIVFDDEIIDNSDQNIKTQVNDHDQNISVDNNLIYLYENNETEDIPISINNENENNWTDFIPVVLNGEIIENIDVPPESEPILYEATKPNVAYQSGKYNTEDVSVQSSLNNKKCNNDTSESTNDDQLSENGQTDLDYNEESETDSTTSSVSAVEEEYPSGIIEPREDFNNENLLEGRKRNLKANKEDWKRNKNKRLRLEGKAYLGFSKPKNKKMSQNVQRESRKLKTTCVSKYCQKSKVRRCSTISEEERKNLFSYFWNEMSWDQRKVYVASNVKKVPSKKKTTEGESRRQGTFQYYIDKQNEKVQVCREMFLNTFDLGYKTVQDWVNKSKYGMHQNTEKKITARENQRTQKNKNIEYLEMFLNSLPKLPSHYARKDSMKLYFEPVFKNLVDVYKLYKTKCENENVHCLSKKIFYRTFKEKNFSIYQLKKDQCNVCSEYKVGNIPEEQWLKHKTRKDRARKEKEIDKENALKEECLVLAVDLQAVKLCPSVNANAFYYKTKLCMHNFTVYNLKTHQAVCYWFSEDENNELKASTFTSCLLDYLDKYCVTTNKIPIIIYSDGCTYQNRNNVMANALLNFSICQNITVYQKYLEPGHTQMECDSVHAAIERKLKNREIHLPSDYISVTKEARVHPEPYIVVSLEHSFFKNYALPEYLRYTTIRPGRQKDDPVVTDIRCIKYDEGKIEVKIDFDGNWLDLPGRVKNLQPILEYQKLYSQRCKISASKFKHLQELKAVLPKDCHNFYDTLPYA